MCRLYTMHANEPTRVECGLVKSQNALMAQSQGDMDGYSHAHGWGVADYDDGRPLIEKQTWAAFHGEHFAKKAGQLRIDAALPVRIALILAHQLACIGVSDTIGSAMAGKRLPKYLLRGLRHLG